MKQKHTKSKKANRHSGWDTGCSFRTTSEERRRKRLAFQPKRRPCDGFQIGYVQAIEIRVPSGLGTSRTVTKSVSHIAARRYA